MLFTHKYSNVGRISLIFIITGMLLAGCSKQLDIKPEVFISPEELYKDEAGVKSGVVGIYRQLLELKRSDYVIVGMVGTDEGKTTLFVPTWGTYWQNFCAVNTYSTLMTAQNDVVQGFWIDCYRGIGNANVAIRSIPKAPVGDAVKNQALGEARFLRALFYFYLVQVYGGVPMPTEVENLAADAKGGLPRSSEDEVYKLILDDLQFAAANLASKGADGNAGRATKEAATALLGKVYLTRKDWTNAKNTLEPLLSASNVSLMPNYADLFVEANENNIESLFEIQFSNELNNTSNLAANLGCWQINSPELPGAGGHVIIPTDYYFNSFEEGDKRKDATFRTLFYDKDGNPVDYSWWSDVGKPHIKKFDITKGASVSGSLSSRNLYYLRLADVILMYAEAQNELGNTGIAMQNLDKIRNRAGLDNYETVHGTTLNKDQMAKEIMMERMRELGFEGWRWFDLKRTGTLLTEVKAHNIDAAPNIQEKHLLYPIPTREFENNQSLQPSDQNPGY
ncbi:MAG TPA: RagB/SusD family nutrient uptake outer membrane protein [Chitinophaga sp.]|uniref:RagB/SusD family nutrient uptake outer membrane protein n=1 Tax=Chitinophaga sp. TaxID=1869181 RepID=UPI002DB576D3|nr:RagB/SusD family nutrient uptake outer membrane protein [Chitinophaga sp.]HEU4552018.1 RagB/SusD family nutrient uptake outer membrane protein [Chitinophaga sp.]